MRRTRQRELPYGGQPSTNPALSSIVLIAINAAVFVAMAITGGTMGALFDTLALIPQGYCSIDAEKILLAGPSECAAADYTWVDGVATGAWWQVITSAFAHSGAMHVGFNMLALWFLGPQLERIFGRARFLALYLTAALTASAFVMVASSPYMATLGASGSIFGLMGAILLVAHKHKGNVQQILMWLGINVVITVLGASYISWQGHLGGLVGGLAVAAAVLYLPRRHRLRNQWLVIAAIVVLALVIIVAKALSLAP